MLNGETYVLEGVRDIIRNKVQLNSSQCDCEYDEQIPSIAGDFYVAVIPAGFETGPKHNASGGVHDLLHSVQVFVVRRSGAVPRDKRRSVFLDQLNGINALIDKIIRAVDWQLDAMSYINHLMYADIPTAAPFIEPIRLLRADVKPKMVNTEMYAGVTSGQPGSTPYVGMARSVYFGKIRRIQTINQIAHGGTVS